MKLLSVGNNAKTIKSDSLGEYLTAIMYLSPHKLSGTNLCASASAGCAAACLNTAGRGNMKMVQKARLEKTKLFLNDTKTFISILKDDIKSFSEHCNKKQVLSAIRLNGTSDIMWEKYPELFEDSDVQFYDYTKHYKRMQRYLNGDLPINYHLTFSRSETNGTKAIDILDSGGNVAMVFDELPDKIFGYEVISGDEHDLRFTDPYNVIVGLKSKGKAKKDTTGFTIYVTSN